MTMSAETLESPSSAKLGPDAVVCLDAAVLAQLEIMKGQIMADLEAKLSQKEDSLWKRGQVEIQKLQMQQAKTTTVVNQLQERQAVLVNDNHKTQSVIADITLKFESVVNEMRCVLRELPNRARVPGEQLSPSPSAASTSASELARDEDPTPPSTTAGGPWSAEKVRKQAQTSAAVQMQGLPMQQTPVSAHVVQTPVPMWHTRGAGFEAECPTGVLLAELPSFDSEERGNGDCKTFLTPPRVTPSSDDSARADVLAPPAPPSWQGISSSASPAVLSLASALPSASTATAVTPNPSPGLKLHLAEHLEQQLDVTATTPASMPYELASANAAGAPTTPLAQSEYLRIELAKDQGFVTLGMEVNQKDGSSLRIESIDDHGLVARYNLQQLAETSKLHVGDRIVDVNGVSGDTNAMLQECKVQQRLVFAVARDSCQIVAGSDMPLVTDETAVVRSAVATDAEVASPHAPKQLRPDAEVFIPSAQKEPAAARTTPTGSLSMPPGLGGYDVGNHLSLSAGLGNSTPSSLLATAPPQQMSYLSAQDPMQVLSLQSVAEHAAFDEAGVQQQQQDVKRALFS